MTTLPVDLSLHVEQIDGGIRGTLAGPDGAVAPFAGWLELTARIAGVLSPAEEDDSSDPGRPVT